MLPKEHVFEHVLFVLLASDDSEGLSLGGHLPSQMNLGRVVFAFFSPKNGWLEFGIRSFPFGGMAYFQVLLLLVSGGVVGCSRKLANG